MVWVGVLRPFLRGQQGKTSRVSLAIFFDPAYFNSQTLKQYAEDENCDMDGDLNGFEHKLERVWGRRINILRIYKGTLRSLKATLHAQTVYRNLNHPVLEHLRSSFFQKTLEYKEKLNGSRKLATIASQSEDSLKGYQYANCGHVGW